MDISVIVVTYNQQDTIGRTLDSILAQQFAGEYEIVIGDDASTDGTRSVCEEYASRFPDRVRYIRRDKNLGVARNYFDCIANSRGRYLADCAGDDFWVDPTKLQREYDYLESHPDTTMVATDWLCCDPDGTNVCRSKDRAPVSDVEVYERGDVCADILTHRVTPHLCSALYRRSTIMDALATDSAIMVSDDYTCEDTQILLCCGAAGRITILPGVSLHYSVGHDSISHRADFGKRFDHSLASKRQTLRIADHFGVARDKYADNVKKSVDFLHALAFLSNTPRRAEALRAFIKEAAIKGGFKSRVYACILRCRPLWKILLSIRHLVRRHS